MLDIKLIREHPEIVRNDLKKRGETKKIEMVEKLIDYDKKWRELLVEVNKLRQKRNLLTKEITKLKREGKDISEKLKEAKEIPDKIKRIEKEANTYKEKIRYILMRLPNILHESVPVGKDEHDNVEIRRWGKPPKFDFEPKDHLTILKNLGL